MSDYAAERFFDARRATWVAYEGFGSVSSTTTGPVAVHVLGDLVFNITMSCILNLVHARLRYENLIARFDTALALAFFLKLPQPILLPYGWHVVLRLRMIVFA